MEPLYCPSEDMVESSNLRQFCRQVGLGDVDYDVVHHWSVAHADAFWAAIWDFCGVVGDRGDAVLQSIETVPYARFFPDSKISYTENMLQHALACPEDPAIIFRRQDEADDIISGRSLCARVSVWQQVLEGLGVGEGDRVGVYLPNIPEAMIVLLAASNLGAVFVSAGMEMGEADLIGRFKQAHPKVLVTQDCYVHGAKKIDRCAVVDRAVAAIDTIAHVIKLGVDADSLLARYEPQDLVFIRRDFNHPLYILFSSGSTGAPKCFEHSSGGVLLKHLVEYQLHADVKAGDRVFYHATPSWMMWNWLLSGLGSGATLLIYDGNPFYPTVSAQWDFTQAHGCTHHGTAAPVVLGWEDAGLDLVHRDMEALRMVLSTGAVLPAQSYHYIHKHVKADVKIASIAGGTDLVGCFLGGHPLAPTYEAQTNGAILGCDVQVWDGAGDVVPVGQAGELVCVNAFPSMPLRFLNDEDGTRYEAAYFSAYAGRDVWCHGDTIQQTPEGQFVIVGRSDATLNQNGVRIGPAVIYEQLASFSGEVCDYAAVDFMRPDNKQAITVLFLVMEAGVVLSEDLRARIQSAIKDNVTPYAVPTEMIVVPSLLKTPNGKCAEIVMKKVISGASIANASLYGTDLVLYFEKIGYDLQKKYLEGAA